MQNDNDRELRLKIMGHSSNLVHGKSYTIIDLICPFSKRVRQKCCMCDCATQHYVLVLWSSADCHRVIANRSRAVNINMSTIRNEIKTIIYVTAHCSLLTLTLTHCLLTLLIAHALGIHKSGVGGRNQPGDEINPGTKSTRIKSTRG